MKKYTMLLGILLTAFAMISKAQDTWTQKTDFGGTERLSAVGFSIGTKGYIGTGGKYPDPPYSDFWEYDPATDVWTQKADFAGTPREYAVGFSIGNKGYVGTGYNNGTVYKDFWEYDPTTNNWVQKADFGGVARSFAAGFSIGMKGYLGTGASYPYYYKDFWEYDPVKDIWTQKADFGGDARSYAVGFNTGNKGYLGTGFQYPNYYKDFWEYDPITDTWIQKADFSGTARAYAIGFGIGDKGYLGTGGSISYGLKDFWEYDPVANSWLRKADLGGVGREYAVGFSIGSKGYLGTGSIRESPYSTKDFWEYTPGPACPAPIGLKVPYVGDNYAILKWGGVGSDVLKLQIRYRASGGSAWIKQRKNPAKNGIYIDGLIPNTAYCWQLRSFCAYDTSLWVSGPEFTTASSFALADNKTANIYNKPLAGAGIQVMPNPVKNNFTVQMQLSEKESPTTLSLYDGLGQRVWQQSLGSIKGQVIRNIGLGNALSAGIYTLKVERSDMHLIQKVVVKK